MCELGFHLLCGFVLFFVIKGSVTDLNHRPKVVEGGKSLFTLNLSLLFNANEGELKLTNGVFEATRKRQVQCLHQKSLFGKSQMLP